MLIHFGQDERAGRIPGNGQILTSGSKSGAWATEVALTLTSARCLLTFPSLSYVCTILLHLLSDIAALSGCL